MFWGTTIDSEIRHTFAVTNFTFVASLRSVCQRMFIFTILEWCGLFGIYRRLFFSLSLPERKTSNEFWAARVGLESRDGEKQLRTHALLHHRIRKLYDWPLLSSFTMTRQREGSVCPIPSPVQRLQGGAAGQDRVHEFPIDNQTSSGTISGPKPCGRLPTCGALMSLPHRAQMSVFSLGISGMMAEGPDA